MDAFASALRLPEGALPPADGNGASDDVFMRLMGLHKGRSLLARALREAPPSPILELSTILFGKWQHCTILKADTIWSQAHLLL